MVALIRISNGEPDAWILAADMQSLRGQVAQVKTDEAEELLATLDHIGDSVERGRYPIDWVDASSLARGYWLLSW